MQYWTTSHYPPMVSPFKTRKLGRIAASVRPALYLLLLLLMPGGQVIAGGSPPYPKPVADIPPPLKTLKTHSAMYTGNIGNISADLQQKLTKTNNNRWELHNSVSSLFATASEKSLFSIAEGHITPHHYRYENNLNSKKNSNLTFNWDALIATEQERSNRQVKLQRGFLDKLAYEAQLRLDLMNDKDLSTEASYQLIDKGRVKTYLHTFMGAESLSTPAGQFETLKIKQRRPGKEKYTLIWLAKNWDYFVVKVQRFEDGQSQYEVVLKQAALNGQRIVGQ